MRFIYAALLILLIAGCTKEPEPPEVSPMSTWLPSTLNEYDLAPEYAIKKLPVL
ncbi:hypothetical protein [Jeotgalibacillus haloalkalitolerans]|uniref:Uncharacterized protein n=1 Tax=Jeotgalibacillus haloalkalitolerans TaxID=3104292 RepID=A0ABU5KR87_9BACL|nr:hypothetical protein [Jeotgalibacillus sp. HH7-29]MDZ5713608.1 hypothetical protein [Jeotgalibacillus sp. HH7-29]